MPPRPHHWERAAQRLMRLSLPRPLELTLEIGDHQATEEQLQGLSAACIAELERTS